MKKNYLLLIFALSFKTIVLSQVSLTGPAYSQDFNPLANSGTANVISIPGWLLTETGGGARDNEQYAADDGGSSTGDTYSYGATSGTERALGSLRSGTLIPVFGAFFANNTGVTITSLTISYTGEEWRLGTAGRADNLDFQYSLDATGLSDGTWTDADALDFNTPNTVSPPGMKDGASAVNQTAVSGTITGLSIPNGATFYIRWVDADVTGADDGLAIDDFTLSTNPVLPVTLINFAVTRQNATCRINWSTAQEINIREFNVQRLTMGNAAWETIATIPARGFSNISVNYVLTDTHPASGTNLYRLQSVDLDSKFYFSDIRSINFDNKHSYSVYPNPAKNTLQITADNSAGFAGHLLIQNIRGQTLLDKEVRTPDAVLQFDISSLKPGSYILKINAEDGEMHSLKFVRL